VKKLKNKIKSQRLTCFRKNNEVNLLIIKKICRSIIDSQNQNEINGAPVSPQAGSFLLPDYSILANDVLEAMRASEKGGLEEIVKKLE